MSLTVNKQGWYPERTPHIHVRVVIERQIVLIGEVYLIDALSEYIYENVAPYNTRTVERDTVNTTDVALRDGGRRESLVNIKEEADYYLASIIIGVDRNARPTGENPAGAVLQPGSKPTTPLVPGVSSTR